MEPFETPDTPPAMDNTTCVDCDQPLDPGRKLRCNRCIAAARLAIERAGGRTVRPSMIAAVWQEIKRGG